MAVVLFAAAGVAALLGKKQLQQAAPTTPERTMRNVKRDIKQVQKGRHHEHTHQP